MTVYTAKKLLTAAMHLWCIGARSSFVYLSLPFHKRALFVTHSKENWRRKKMHRFVCVCVCLLL